MYTPTSKPQVYYVGRNGAGQEVPMSFSKNILDLLREIKSRIDPSIYFIWNEPRQSYEVRRRGPSGTNYLLMIRRPDEMTSGIINDLRAMDTASTKYSGNTAKLIQDLDVHNAKVDAKRREEYADFMEEFYDRMSFVARKDDSDGQSAYRTEKPKPKNQALKKIRQQTSRRR